MIRHSEGYVAFIPNSEGNKKVDECMYNSSVTGQVLLLCFSTNSTSSSVMLHAYLLMEYYKAN